MCASVIPLSPLCESRERIQQSLYNSAFAAFSVLLHYISNVNLVLLMIF